MNTLLTIEQLGEVVAVLGPLAIETALKIRSLLQLSPDFTVNVKNLSQSAITTNAATEASIAAWLVAQGLPVITTQPT